MNGSSRFTQKPAAAGGLSRSLLRLMFLALGLIAAPSLNAVIVISEIQYHPRGNDSELEYIELHNETPDPMDLTGYFFSRGIDFTFTDRTFLDPGAYLVVCANKDRIAAAYGITNVVGNWSPETSLKNSGESIELSNPAGVVEARVTYNDRGKWPSGADGTGHSLELKDVYADMDDPDHWALSGKMGGSPGQPNNTLPGAVSVVINEALLTGNSGERWMELYNHGKDDVDLSGFHVSNNQDDLSRATLAAGTTLAAGKWLVLSDRLTGLDFGPDKSGRSFLALVSPTGDRVIDARTFEPNTLYPGLSEARIPDGDSFFSSSADPTPNAANQITVQSDIVINEIFYHPIDGDPRGEFVELYNRGSQAIDLTGWSVSDGVRFEFPDGTVVDGHGHLVVARDPANIRAVYGLPATAVLGPPGDSDALDRFGTLADSGERVSISDARGNIVDTVRYFDGGEWPRWADGGGSSMELIDPNQDNSFAQAWDSSDESQKSEATRYSYKGTLSSSTTFADPPEFHLVMTGSGITVVDDLTMVSRVSTFTPETIYVTSNDTWKLKKGTEEASVPVTAWRELEYDDSAWTDAQAIIGFGEFDETTVLDDMRKFGVNPGYASFFVRKTFQVADLAALKDLVLEIQYDDGFVAYLNGVEVASGNMDLKDRAYKSLALLVREKQKDLVDLAAWKPVLRAGRNVLAIQVHNQSLVSNDARFSAQLASGTISTEEGSNLFKDGSFETVPDKPAWVLQGTHVRSGRTTAEAISGEGSLKIVSTGGGDNKVNRIETSNTGLTAPRVRTVYDISFLAKWICGTPTLLTHGSYQGSDPPSYAASTPLMVPRNLGTPGAPNSVTLRQVAETGSSSNLGPVIKQVKHAPSLPAANEAVTIEARIYDPDGVSSAVVKYSLDTPKVPGDPALLEVPMTDEDGDGVYTAQIPGQALKKKVVYCIVARDSRGQLGRWPLDHVHRTNPLILDPSLAGANDDQYAVYRHDTPFAGKPQSFRFWMHGANEQYLSSRLLHSNDLVAGTLLFQSRDVYYNAGIRFSGSPFARQAWTESYRMRLPKDNPLQGTIESFNMEDHQDGGAVSAKERISNYLLRWHQGQTIVPYSLQWYVQLQVNDRVNELRELVQTPNAEFIGRWWPGDDRGSFFEMDDRHTFTDDGSRENSVDAVLLYPPYGASGLGGDKEQYRHYFNLRLKEEEDDFSELIKLARLLTTSQTPDNEFDRLVWDQVDVESFCRYWSIRMNTDDWDCWGTNRGKNCYLYRPEGAGKWYLIPWDMELTYTNSSSFLPPALTATSNSTYLNTFAEVTRFINRPRIKRLYYGILKEMIDRQFQSSFLLPYMQKLDAVGAQWTDIGKPKGFIDTRRKMLQTVVKGVTMPTISFTITTNGGQPLEIEWTQLELKGKAPVEIRDIVVRIDGKDPTPPWRVEFSSTDLLGWTVSGSLSLGEHTVELVGFTSDLAVVASTSITVTVLPAVPPVISAVTPLKAVVGELVTITGTGFRATSRVLFGEVQAAQVTFNPEASQQIVAAVPAGVPLEMVEVRVENLGGIQSDPFAIQVVAEKKRFLRGDSDRSGQVNLTDALYSLDFLFQQGQLPLCMDAGDVDDDGSLNITDAIVLLRFLFQGGAQPPAPFPEVAEDPTPLDPLTCAIGVE